MPLVFVCASFEWQKDASDPSTLCVEQRQSGQALPCFYPFYSPPNEQARLAIFQYVSFPILILCRALCYICAYMLRCNVWWRQAISVGGELSVKCPWQHDTSSSVEALSEGHTAIARSNKRAPLRSLSSFHRRLLPKNVKPEFIRLALLIQ